MKIPKQITPKKSLSERIKDLDKQIKDKVSERRDINYVIADLESKREKLIKVGQTVCLHPSEAIEAYPFGNEIHYYCAYCGKEF